MMNKEIQANRFPGEFHQTRGFAFQLKRSFLILACLIGCEAFLWAGSQEVTPAARFKGNFGIRFDVGQGPDSFLNDGSPLDEPEYTARFYLCLNRLNLAEGNSIQIMAGLNSVGFVQFEAQIVKSGGIHRLVLRARLDNNSFVTSSAIALGRGWKAIQVIFTAGAGTGSLQGLVEGDQVLELANLANGSSLIDVIRFGKMDETGIGNNGSFDMDDFESRKFTIISPLCLSDTEYAAFLAEWPNRNILEELDLLEKRCPPAP